VGLGAQHEEQSHTAASKEDENRLDLDVDSVALLEFFKGDLLLDAFIASLYSGK